MIVIIVVRIINMRMFFRRIIMIMIMMLNFPDQTFQIPAIGDQAHDQEQEYDDVGYDGFIDDGDVFDDILMTLVLMMMLIMMIRRRRRVTRIVIIMIIRLGPK